MLRVGFVRELFKINGQTLTVRGRHDAVGVKRFLTIPMSNPFALQQLNSNIFSQFAWNLSLPLGQFIFNFLIFSCSIVLPSLYFLIFSCSIVLPSLYFERIHLFCGSIPLRRNQYFQQLRMGSMENSHGWISSPREGIFLLDQLDGD